MKTVTSTAAVADVVNTSSMVEEIIEAAQEQVMDGTDVLDLSIKDAEIFGFNVRYVGTMDILSQPKMSIIMSSPAKSRDGKKLIGGPSNRAKAAAKAASVYFAEQNCTTIIAGLRDTDKLVADACLGSGGHLAIVFPMGLGAIYESLKPDEVKALNAHILNGDLLLISICQDDSAGWEGQAAMQRNKLLAAMSDSILIPHCHTTYSRQNFQYTGGIMNLLYAASENDVPVFVPEWRQGDPESMLVIQKVFNKNVTELGRGSADEVLSVMIG